MKEATYYRSNQDMSLYGSGHYLHAIPSGPLYMAEDCTEAYYVSDVFDGGELQQSWDELHLHITDCWELNVSIWVFDDIDMKEQFSLLTIADRYHVIELSGFSSTYEDVVLYGQEECRGRYLVFGIYLRKPKGHIVTFTAYELSYPAILFSEYLPSIYHGNPDLDRYLSIFKDVYLTLEAQVDHFYEELDPLTASEDHVRTLLQWQGYDHYLQYAKIDDLRMLSNFMVDYQHVRGTLSYVYHLTNLLFHKPAALIWKHRCLHVYMKVETHEIEQRLCAFFQQEMMAGVTVQIHFVLHGCYDESAYLGITSLLSTSMCSQSYDQTTSIMR